MSETVLVTRPSMPTLEEYVNEISDIWETKWLTNMGTKHQALEEELSEYLGVDHHRRFLHRGFLWRLWHGVSIAWLGNHRGHDSRHMVGSQTGQVCT